MAARMTAGTTATRPHRRTLAAAELVLAVAGTAGAVQLATNFVTPPVSDLDPLGLSSWTLPGVWLFGTVAVPSAVAGWLTWRGAEGAPIAVLVASGLLAVELLVQIPFVGGSALQVVFGSAAAGLAWLALDARRRGWRAAGATSR